MANLQNAEQQLWRWLADRMGNTWMAQRIESTRTAPGIPDVYFSCREPDLRGWIELKSMQRWGADDQPFDPACWKPDQRNWMQRHHGSGGNTWLAVEFREAQEVVLLPSAVLLAARVPTNGVIRRMPWTIAKRNAGAREILDALLAV